MVLARRQYYTELAGRITLENSNFYSYWACGKQCLRRVLVSLLAELVMSLL